MRNCGNKLSSFWYVKESEIGIGDNLKELDKEEPIWWTGFWSYSRFLTFFSLGFLGNNLLNIGSNIVISIIFGNLYKDLILLKSILRSFIYCINKESNWSFKSGYFLIKSSYFDISSIY